MPLRFDAEALTPFTANESPASQLDFLATVGFRAAGAALRLGVFEALAAGPRQGREVAEAIGGDLHATEALLGALVAFGYLDQSGDDYANSPLSRRWLTDQPGGYASVFNFWQSIMFDLWSDLEESVRQGRRMADFYTWIGKRPALHADFQAMLARQASGLGEEVAGLVPLPDTARRLLDIGGSHAQYSLAFCRRHPRLTATVLDFPEALDSGAAAVAEAGLGDRIVLRPGNWTSADLEPDQDLVLLFNVLHGNGPEENVALLHAVSDALRPGGTVALLGPSLEAATAAGPVAETYVRVFNLNLLHTQGGRVYSRDELFGWLSEAGLTDARHCPLPSAPTESLIIARKPGRPATEGFHHESAH